MNIQDYKKDWIQYVKDNSSGDSLEARTVENMFDFIKEILISKDELSTRYANIITRDIYEAVNLDDLKITMHETVNDMIKEARGIS